MRRGIERLAKQTKKHPAGYRDTTPCKLQRDKGQRTKGRRVMTKERVLVGLESWQQGKLRLLFAVVLFVFRLDHFHEQVLIFDGYR